MKHIISFKTCVTSSTHGCALLFKGISNPWHTHGHSNPWCCGACSKFKPLGYSYDKLCYSHDHNYVLYYVHMLTHEKTYDLHSFHAYSCVPSAKSTIKMKNYGSTLELCLVWIIFLLLITLLYLHYLLNSLSLQLFQSTSFRLDYFFLLTL